jgi:formylglycine-generating enzyme required for sulfatase activity
MNKNYLPLVLTAASLIVAAPLSSIAADHSGFVYETTVEFFGSGDFDGDGRIDLVIVDKQSGKFRLGYQTSSNILNWVDCRYSGLKGVAGFSIGKLTATNTDGLLFSSPDGNQLAIVSASSSTSAGKPVAIPFTAGLGPSALAAVDVGGAGNTALADIYVSSIYNSPDANLATLLRNDGAEFPKIGESVLLAPALHLNHIIVKPGQPELLCLVLSQGKADTFHGETLADGKAVDAVLLGDLPAGSDYAVGSFRAGGLPEIIFFKTGEAKITVKPLAESGPGKLQLEAGGSYDLGQPIGKVVTLGGGAAQRLFVIFGQGESAGVFTFDGVKPPTRTATIISTNELLTGAADVPNGLIAFSHPPDGKFSTRYLAYTSSGNDYTFSRFGGLPSLADNDNITIPDIFDRIVSSMTATNESGMKAYTNTIPGTQVAYGMVAIPGGEFTMGSPDTEPSRKPDEGPMHKVRISPFWMGQCEVTWNEYELFMYPDEERRTRATIQTDATGDKLADAVTHPSKPYVEMSFGMGKDGFPAISMTQHGANKYCQWLSAKTGHFYRLPTEAEWEYACRAGTTTTYFFGDEASKLGEYAWYEQNSDFKYQKVGKKKPSPWGLYDIYGNVVEWVLDQYDADFYKKSAAQGTMNHSCAEARHGAGRIAPGKCRTRNCPKACGTIPTPNGSAFASFAR